MNMMTIRKAVLFLAAIVLPGGKSEPNVPVFELKDLVGSDTLNDFWLTQILTTTGLFAIRHPAVMEYRPTALNGLCRCMFKIPEKDGILDQAVLDDGITQRTTLGVGTAGTTPLTLPQESEIIKACGMPVVKAMEGLRDQVAVVTAAFVKALDRILMTPDGSDRPLLKHIYGGSYPSISAIQAAANHLEHFHVYSKKQVQREESTNAKSTLEWHVDAGLFLSFVPALDCTGDSFKDAAFYLPTGQVAEFPLDSVVIMLGAGAQYWLDTTSASLKLQATRHAVEMKPGQMRAWYGMMSLVPDIAIVQEYPTYTFGDMKKQMALLPSTSKGIKNGDQNAGVETAIVIGCGLQEPQEEQRESIVLEVSNGLLGHPFRRRRLHGATPASCNNETNFFCWMKCLDIPEPEKIDHYLHQDYSLYCMDPAIYVTQGGNIMAAVAPCKDLQTANRNCSGQWAPTSSHVKGYDLGRNISTNTDQGDNSTTTGDGDDDGDGNVAAVNSKVGGGDGEAKFCYGASTMLHDGFHWTSTVCIVYLFQGWVLTDEGKLAAACLGTIAMGLILEFILFQRRHINHILQGYMRLTASAVTYGAQLTLGYWLMLVAMTFSGALFMCIIVGLVAGHICFNAKDALFAKGKNGTKAGIYHQEAGSHGTGDEDNSSGDGGVRQGPSPSDLKVDDDLKDDNGGDSVSTTSSNKVPLGITPCCQNNV